MQRFHSFGITARDCYNDLDPREASKWLYFDKFKMILHHNQEINRNTTVVAANGRSVAALSVFSLTLRYFKDHALRYSHTHSMFCFLFHNRLEQNFLVQATAEPLALCNS